MPQHVVFSERSFVALLAETLGKIDTETGGVFLGHRTEDTWYVIDSIDPGPRSIFQPCYFEYDSAYINHIINKINRLYRKPLDLLGLWHRHPGSLDSFSSTDDGTNKEYATLNKAGSISALVNIDPAFRLTVYSVVLPLRYEKVRFKVGDHLIPAPLMDYAPIQDLLAKINGGISPARDSKSMAIQQALSAMDGVREMPPQLAPATRGFTFGVIFMRYLQDKRNVKKLRMYLKPAAATNEDIDRFSELLADDLDYLAGAGFGYSIRKNDAGVLEFHEARAPLAVAPLKLEFFLFRKKLMFNYSGQTYQYRPGLFKSVFSFISMAGGNAK